jgi:RHS repeat-associated protein
LKVADENPPKRSPAPESRSEDRDPKAAAPRAQTDDDDKDIPRAPQLPAPSFPKGGGAVRGLGETFQVNAANGTFTSTIPLALPTARGLEPPMALRYDSGAGNGPFGVGWSIGLGSIARKTDKVLPRYHDDDIFVLSEGEDLVVAEAPDGGPWVKGTRDAGTHNVRCYRPRVEASYDRVERWTRKSDGDVHWRARSKDGKTTVFGEDPQARVADGARVFRWLVDRVLDDRGNLISYRYRSEDRMNVVADLWEDHRAPTNTLIDRVLYGTRVPYDASGPAPSDPAAYLFEVVFDYGERDGATPPPYDPPGTWTVRADPFSNFKPGFEVRQYRLCKAILTFHRTTDATTLVRELRLAYDGDPALTKLVGVTAVGWQNAAPLEYPQAALGYSVAKVDPTIQQIDAGSAENLPPPVDGRRTRWLDLDGEGIPGALVEDRPGWFYKRNLGAGRLASVERLPERPGLELSDGGRLVDLGGDGIKSLAHFDGPAPGHYARGIDFDWRPFAAFSSLPRVAFDDPNLRFIDLDGDGRLDILVSEDEVMRWYPSLGYDGFGEAAIVHNGTDEEVGPRLVFANAEQALYLADMTGDGLTDLVRIRDGAVCYWPNLGFGRFGAKITMGNAPRFAAQCDFSQANVRLADIDGTGTTDILYCDGAEVRYRLNLAGNRFSDEAVIGGLPYDASSTVEAVDLLGNGTSCLVWSSPLPWHARQPLRYVDLTSGIKPHLLTSIDNGLGRAISVGYAPSTKFYLQDRAAGTPWVTRMPFAVQVVEQISVVDQIAQSQLSSEYSYRHGFYDSFEREFRGFGMVEQRDTQSLSALQSSGNFPANVDYVPPARTRTWFHTGAVLQRSALTAAYRSEWFAADADQAQLDDGILPAGLDPEEWREAVRALRGKPLRTEVYADDLPATTQTPFPYRVVESNYQVRLLQNRGDRPHAVFACDPLETLTYDYERVPSDPRVSHTVVLAVGLYGGIEREARIGYPRRGSAEGTLIRASERDFLARENEAEIYRVNVIADARSYEITGLTPPATSPFVLTRPALQPLSSLAGTADDLAYDQAPDLSRVQRRLTRRSLVSYYADDDVTPLVPGSFGQRALVYQTQRAVAPASLIFFLMPPAVNAALMTTCGYLEHDNYWWCPSNTIGYSASAFFQPAQFIDPFGATTTVSYDPFQLLPARIENALLQTVQITYDPLALLPSSIIDVNGNSTLANYDALGQLRDLAKTGKNGEGDTLAAPTMHCEYTLRDWSSSTGPNHSYVRQRLVHGQNVFGETYVYTDGFGREILTKVKANDGPASQISGGVVATVQTSDRWVASGRTVYDNKGNAVRKYEPFFAVGSAWEPDSRLVFIGVTPVLHYDPLGRTVRTDFPDGSFATTTFSAWEQRDSDGNDNVVEETALWANRPGQSAADQRAVTATRLHRRTPARRLLDSLGRSVATFADNTQQDPVTDVPDAGHVLYETRRQLDIDGNVLATFDDRGAKALPPWAALAQSLDMLGRALQSIGAESGTSHTLADCSNAPVYQRDARGMELTWTYDVLRRPIALTANDTTSGASFGAEKTVYGDDPALGAVDPNANLVGRVYQKFDQAGVVTNHRYDFKGNVVETERQLISGYKGAPDWSRPYLTPFARTSEFDALDRVTRSTLPRRNPSAGGDNVVERSYLPQGPLGSVRISLQYGSAPVDVLSSIDYDAKGRRVTARYGNGILRTYVYDPLTFRLMSLSSARGTGTFQDIRYTYDAVGNITEIADVAQATIFNRNQQIDARLAYTYDSIYRLTDASGRELHDLAQPDDGEPPFGTWPPDGNDLVNFSEHYDFDSAGNLLTLSHTANQNTQSWTRGYEYDGRSNKLTGTSLPGAPSATVYGASYLYDAAGNIRQMPHLPTIGWDERVRFVSADQRGGGIVYNRYDSDGNRVRKVLTQTTTGSETISYERIYLGEYEVYRLLDAAGNATTEIETVHGLDGPSRAALCDTQTSDTKPSPVVRFQLDNHLGSAITELDENGALLSYEEFHPFGTSAYHAHASIAEVSLRRYRFLGKERDAETGFDYCQARHYCSWLGRWINPDPKGLEGGTNLYVYSNNSPIVLRDPGGRDPEGPQPVQSTVGLGSESAIGVTEPVVDTRGGQEDTIKSGPLPLTPKEVIARGDAIADRPIEPPRDLSNVDLRLPKDYNVGPTPERQLPSLPEPEPLVDAQREQGVQTGLAGQQVVSKTQRSLVFYEQLSIGPHDREQGPSRGVNFEAFTDPSVYLTAEHHIGDPGATAPTNHSVFGIGIAVGSLTVGKGERLVPAGRLQLNKPSFTFELDLNLKLEADIQTLAVQFNAKAELDAEVRGRVLADPGHEVGGFVTLTGSDQNLSLSTGLRWRF